MRGSGKPVAVSTSRHARPPTQLLGSKVPEPHRSNRPAGRGNLKPVVGFSRLLILSDRTLMWPLQIPCANIHVKTEKEKGCYTKMKTSRNWEVFKSWVGFRQEELGKWAPRRRETEVECLGTFGNLTWPRSWDSPMPSTWVWVVQALSCKEFQLVCCKNS